MRIVRTVAALREALTDAGRVGFVPTMGALHEGHLTLMSTARDECDTVVTSVFVNPTQFNDQTDLAAYPRDEARDAHLADTAGTDLLFVPAVEEVYPQGYATTVSVRGTEDSPQVTIEDMGSTNGIVVDGRRVQTASLRNGSRVELGNTRMLVRSPVSDV